MYCVMCLLIVGVCIVKFVLLFIYFVVFWCCELCGDVDVCGVCVSIVVYV